MEEVENQTSKTDGQAPRGGKKISKWLIVIPVILILVSAATFAGLKFFGEKDPSAATEESTNHKKAKSDKIGPMVPLDPFIVNLAESDGKRYLKITMEMELEEEHTSEELEKRSAQIRNTILILLTSKTFDDIKDVAGKFELREQIVKRVNTQLNSGKIRQIYFTEFVIQ